MYINNMYFVSRCVGVFASEYMCININNLVRVCALVCTQLGSVIRVIRGRSCVQI